MDLFKALVAVSFMTFVSRLLGFVRDVLIARIFGSCAVTDAFFVAWKLPNLLRRLFADGAFSQTFVPILAEYKSQKSVEVTKIFITRVSGLLTLVVGLIVILGIFTSPWLIMATAPGFANTAEKVELSATLLRITFPYILLISLSSLVGSILNTWNYFAVPAFSPALLNLSIIFFSLFAAPYFNPPITVLSWSVLMGGILQLGYQLPYLKKIGLLVLPRLVFHDINVWRLINQMGPAVLSSSVSQISLVINTIFASFLNPGSISWIYYADRLMEFPVGILGVTLGTILFPSLAKSVSSGNLAEYSYLIDWGLRLCFLLACPSAVALGILAKPLIIVLFQYGNFTDFDVGMTQHSLVAYSVGLIGLITMKVLVPGFSVRQDLKTPLKISILTLIVTQIMNIALIGPLEHVGLSLSIGLAACLNTSLLYRQLRKQNLFFPQPGWMCFFFRLIIAVLVMSASLVGVLYLMPVWNSGGMTERLTRLMVVFLIGFSVYILTLGILGFRLRDVLLLYNGKRSV
ncbi:murein biosynthesis integral membrane protein MurJ [Candidatus Erwinia haradaeae]|uniref:Probable lipid II flippase MurJ n=1 Tax=Candidatus Erwinia haradaeae TaxID=1922217 RepID=A0A803GCA9_9GAMM|nr:murein biosynthesis integral membrane protein MurJ [Candidatus Erwinia haradaeae]VFP87547.1 Lipid II flippase MurJ [Candidatus Erwinia haradaeae]